MLFHTDTADAPWTVVKSNDRKRARLEAIRHVLHRFDHPDKDATVAGEPDPLIVGPASRIFEQGEMEARMLTSGRTAAGPEGAEGVLRKSL